MPHISKHKLDRQTEKELFQSFETVLSRIGGANEMNNFLFSILSYTERLMLAKRLGIVLLLEEGVSERSIARALHVTRQTVYRVKQSAEFKSKGYKIALKAIKKDEEIKKFKKALLSLARYSLRAAGGRVSL